MMSDEILPLVDESGNRIGFATRKECHADPALLHPVIHLHVFDAQSRLYLQKRSAAKDLFPGYWDTSIGGHVSEKETVSDALAREAYEELGIGIDGVSFLFAYIWHNENESEFVHTYKLVCREKIFPNSEEISEGRFFSINEIREMIAKRIVTPNFAHEFRLLTGKGILRD